MSDEFVDNSRVVFVCLSLDVRLQIGHVCTKAWGTLGQPTLARHVSVVVDTPDSMKALVFAVELDPPIVQVSLKSHTYKIG